MFLAPGTARRTMLGGNPRDAPVLRSDRFDALLLLLMSLISIAADLLH